MEAALCLVSNGKSLDAITGQHVIICVCGKNGNGFQAGLGEEGNVKVAMVLRDEIRQEQLMLVYAFPAATAPSRQSGLFPLPPSLMPCLTLQASVRSTWTTLCCMPPGLPGLHRSLLSHLALRPQCRTAM